jgi:hypothetical protein
MTIIIHGWMMNPIDGIAALLRGGFSFFGVRGGLGDLPEACSPSRHYRHCDDREPADDERCNGPR